MRRIRVLGPLGPLALLSFFVLPALAYALDLTTGGGFLMDIGDTYSGELSNGSIDAYDGAYYLEINGSSYNVGGAASTTTLAGRNVVMAEVALSGLMVHREIYVPAAGGDYARYLEVLRNTGTTAVTARVGVRGNLGSDSSTVLYATSSGDTVLTTADQWFGTDDADGSSDPSLAHVFQGDGATSSATMATLSVDNFNWEVSVTVPAGGRVALLCFAVQTMTRAAAQAEARRVVATPDDVLVGLDDYLDEIVNFGLATAGAPRVRFDAPFEAAEGDEIEVTATIEDMEGDPTTWSWDTDGDGTFGERAGMMSYTIPAGVTDGPGSFRVGIQATDGTNTTERYRAISITNVDPRITSSPPSLVASVGAPWIYPIEVLDPAGAGDPIRFTLTRAPERMVVGTDGRLTWTPNEREVTVGAETVAVEVSVDDGDMGTTTQAFELTVSPNRAPSAPVPLYPIGDIALLDRAPRLVAGNAIDPDVEDVLTYRFEIDTVDTFDSPALLDSGSVDESSGYTFWYLPMDLSPGHYFWRVRANDGAIDTEPRTESFYIAGDGTTVDGGGGTGGDGGVIVIPDAGDGGGRDGGCTVARRSVGSVGLTGRGSIALLLMAVGMVLFRRGRSRAISAKSAKRQP